MSAGSAISAVGSLVSGFGQFQARKAQARALRMAAKQARRDGSTQAQLAVDEGERAAARAVVMGANMGGGAGGSFAQALEAIERTSMFNARSSIYAGNVEAENRMYESRVARQEATMALVSSVFEAGSSLLGGQMRSREQGKQETARKALTSFGGG